MSILKRQAYIGFVLIMLGVVLAQKSSTQRMDAWHGRTRRYSDTTGENLKKNMEFHT